MKFAELKTSQPSIDENVPVILSVSDDTGTEAFLGFDTEVAKLTHVLASEAAQIVEDVKVPEALLPDVKVPEALLPGAVAPGSDVRDANTCKVAEQATTPDGSLSGHLPAAKGQIDLEENAPKKARVD
ncbi:unnamed protein product [Brassica rapa]|uniref:Uncharacterized protein n=2 Tax=Brassica TaxID=3705 RepID=A0A8D9H7I2_BRACM|nr:unnamed protein product [Brassica napus]CAG7894345.1 unnamed protein product [Brassica rapa]